MQAKPAQAVSAAGQVKRLQDLAQLKMTLLNPKRKVDNFLLLISAWIQTSYGHLPLAWSFSLDARVRGGGIEMVKQGILNGNFMWVILLLN